MALPVFDISRVIGWVKTAIADAAKFVALRLLIISVVTVLVPWAIYKGWLIIQEKLFAFMQTQTGTGSFWDGQMIELTGLAAWLAEQLKFVECFAVLASAASFTFVMRMIKR